MADPTPQRKPIRFDSQGTQCAAWHYPGTNGAVLVMAAGLGVTKEPGTDPLARRFAQEGFSVLAFDYRRLGESGGEPRQVVRISEQLEDWQAAIACARELPEVDRDRVAIWGFSVSGGHVFRVAARNPDLVAAIAQAPNADGVMTGINATRHSLPLPMLRLNLRALRDVVGGLFGRDPLLVPLSGPRGTVVSLGTADAENGPRALNPGNAYPEWQQEIAARSAIRVGYYRPGRDAPRIEPPILVMAFEGDGVTPPGQAIKAAKRAPRGELARFPGSHYQAFLDQGVQDRAMETMLSFLRRHALSEAAPVSEAAPAEPTQPRALAV